MTKKVALVDYDESLVVEGELNEALISDLAGRDPVIIFSQREAHAVDIQIITIAFSGGKPIHETISALKERYPQKTILFSSSHDQFFPFPDPFTVGKYYDSLLEGHEKKCINHQDLKMELVEINSLLQNAKIALEDMNANDSLYETQKSDVDTLQAEYDNKKKDVVNISSKIDALKEMQKQHVSKHILQMTRDNGTVQTEGEIFKGAINGRSIEVNLKTKVASGKVTQFFHLHNQLQQHFKGEALEYMWYEDVKENINEMRDALSSEMVPTFKVVHVGENGSLSKPERLPHFLEKNASFIKIKKLSNSMNPLKQDSKKEAAQFLAKLEEIDSPTELNEKLEQFAKESPRIAEDILEIKKFVDDFLSTSEKNPDAPISRL